MKCKVTTKLGGVEYVFDIEEDKEIEVLHKVAVLGNPPTACDECGVDENWVSIKQVGFSGMTLKNMFLDNKEK